MFVHNTRNRPLCLTFLEKNAKEDEAGRLPTLCKKQQSSKDSSLKMPKDSTHKCEQESLMRVLKSV